MPDSRYELPDSRDGLLNSRDELLPQLEMIPQVFTFLRLKARFLKLDHKKDVNVSENDLKYYIISSESHLCYEGCPLATVPVVQVSGVLKKDAVTLFSIFKASFSWKTDVSLHLWLFLPNEDIVNQPCARSTK